MAKRRKRRPTNNSGDLYKLTVEIPHILMKSVRLAALEQDLKLYAFVVNALERELALSKSQPAAN